MADLEVQGQQCFTDLGDSSLTNTHASQLHGVDDTHSQAHACTHPYLHGGQSRTEGAAAISSQISLNWMTGGVCMWFNKRAPEGELNSETHNCRNTHARFA